MICDKDGNFSGLCLGGVDLTKAKDNSINYGSKFNGIASTERYDREDQVILQKGLDFTPFIDYGYFNDGHPVKDKKGKIISSGKMVAVPVGKKAWFEKALNQWHVEGQFLPHVKEANGLVDLAKSFSDIETPRRLGLSVEGKITDADDEDPKKAKVIKKALIYRVTITPQPVNPDAELNLLAKAIRDEIAFQEKSDETLASLSEKEKISAIINISKSRKISVDEAINLFYKHAHKVKL